MACVPIDDRHPRENAIVSFNTIGNNSISHHVPIPGTPGPRGIPLCTPKRIAKNVEEKVSQPSIDGYTIHHDDEVIETSASRASCVRCLLSFGYWYGGQLETNPVRTKSLTAGSLAVVGDVLAQIIEFGTDLKDKDVLFDRRRILAMFIEGSCVSGPMLHFVFEFYEYIIPIHCVEECVHLNYCDDISLDNADQDNTGTISPSDNEYEVSKRQYIAALIHVAFDQVFMSFPYVAGMMIVTSLVEGHGNLVEELEEEYMTNVKASWMAALGLAPIQFVAFRYLPMTWRVLAVNFQDIVWVMVMSYVTHRTRETSEPFFDSATDDFADHDDLFSVHVYNATVGDQ